MSIFNSVT